MIKLIVDKGKKLPVEVLLPENWNELLPQQLVQIAAIMLAATEPLMRKVQYARIFLDQKATPFKKYQSETLVESIFPMLAWLEDDVELTEQLLPEIAIGDVVLHGPKTELQNLRLAEWDFAEHCMMDWYDERGNPEHIARLVAVLYRPGKEGYDAERDVDGDIRQPFNDNLIDYYTKQIMQHVPVAVQFAVLLWYRGCRNFILQNHSFLFGNGKGKSKSEPGYFDLMRAIAKDGTYGDFDKVEQMYLNNALHELRCAHEEAERLKKSTK